MLFAFSKIHNIEPRYSGDVEVSSLSLLNGSQTDSNLSTGSSNDDTMSAPRRKSDEEDDDDDDEEENMMPKFGARARPTIQRRPCMNFFRPLIPTAGSPDRVSSGAVLAMPDSLIPV